VVVPLIRALVPCRFSRNLNGVDHAGFEERVDGSIDRRHTQSVNAGRRMLEQFMNAQRPFGALYYLLKRMSLSGLAAAVAYNFRLHGSLLT
jgi:hypothetical protein